MAPVRAHAALLVGLVGSLLAGCQSVAVLSDPDVPTGGPIAATESTLNRVGDLFAGPDTSLEAQQLLGDRLASQALGRARRADDEALEGYLTSLARRIAAHTDARIFAFQVYLVEDRRPNAFTPGGGHIFITTGLVSRLRTEAQMAMVLSHEIAHNAEAHIVKGAHRRAVSKRASNASKTVFDDKLGLTWVGEKIGSAINATVNVYTSDQEDEADELGLDYMIAAGYDPAEAIATFESLMASSEPKRTIVDLGWNASAKDRRISRIRNLMVAKYKDRTFPGAVRSTPAYDALASRYWQMSTALPAVPPLPPAQQSIQ